jgi:hypothetical protein
LFGTESALFGGAFTAWSHLETPNKEYAMDSLIQQIVQRTGISEAQARQAVETVVGHLKGRVPAPLASQLDKLIAGGSGGASGGEGPGGLAGGLGGLFGGKS